MSKYDFDKVTDRRGTSSLKYDFGMERRRRDDLLPLWVADMDFRTSSYVEEALVERAKNGVFGYTESGEDYHCLLPVPEAEIVH